MASIRECPNFSVTFLCNQHIRHHARKQSLQVRRHLHQHRILTGIYRNPCHNRIHPILRHLALPQGLRELFLPARAYLGVVESQFFNQCYQIVLLQTCQ